jgi:hypothetical protein
MICCCHHVLSLVLSLLIFVLMKHWLQLVDELVLAPVMIVVAFVSLEIVVDVDEVLCFWKKTIARNQS